MQACNRGQGDGGEAVGDRLGDQFYAEVQALVARGEAATPAQVAAMQAKLNAGLLAMGIRLSKVEAESDRQAQRALWLACKVEDTVQAYEAAHVCVVEWMRVAYGYWRWAIWGWAVAGGLMLVVAVVSAMLVRHG